MWGLLVEFFLHGVIGEMADFVRRVRRMIVVAGKDRDGGRDIVFGVSWGSWARIVYGSWLVVFGLVWVWTVHSWASAAPSWTWLDQMMVVVGVLLGCITVLLAGLALFDSGLRRRLRREAAAAAIMLLSFSGIAGVALSRFVVGDYAEQRAALDYLRALIPAPMSGCFPYLDELDVEAVGAAIEPALFTG